MDQEVFPGDLEVVAGSDNVRDVRCFCTAVVVPDETAPDKARAALASFARHARAWPSLRDCYRRGSGHRAAARTRPSSSKVARLSW